MNKRWQPVPMAVAAEALKCSWSKDNPAPKPMGYLWCWCLLEQGAVITRRELAKTAGWSEWKARNVLDEVTADFNEWKHGPPKTAQDSPKTAQDTPVKSSGYELLPPKVTAPHARVPIKKQKQVTTTNNSRDKIDEHIDEVWSFLKRLRPGDFRLTSRTRKSMRSRIKDTSPDEVKKVFDWWQNASHPRAVWLRKQEFGISTILSEENFFEYLKFANQPKQQQQVDPTDPFAALALARQYRQQGGTSD
tara:strand:- start:164 stop:907 length:744 start_codon:yes stop_codon:yes gene_type:complete